jgi:hypothetical protein
MAPLLPPTTTRYNTLKQKIKTLVATTDDALLSVRLIADLSSTKEFKEMSYVLVRELQLSEEAQTVIGVENAEKTIRISELEKEMEKKEREYKEHIKDISRQILGKG